MHFITVKTKQPTTPGRLRGPLTLRSLVLSGRPSRLPSAPRSLRRAPSGPACPPARPPRCGHPAPGRPAGLGGSRRALRAAPRGWRRREHSRLHGRSERPALLQKAERSVSPQPLTAPLRLGAPRSAGPATAAADAPQEGGTSAPRAGGRKRTPGSVSLAARRPRP